MIRFLTSSPAQLPGAAGAGLVLGLLPGLADVSSAGHFHRASPPAAGRGYPRQSRRARLGQTHTHPVRGMGVRRGPGRFRHHSDRSSRLPGVVAPSRGQFSAGGDRFAGGHADRRGPGSLGSGPSVSAERPGDHCAVADRSEHPVVRAGRAADPGRAAGQQPGRGADLFLYRGDLADSARRNLGPVRRPRSTHRACRVSPWPSARPRASAGTNATRCSTC